MSEESAVESENTIGRVTQTMDAATALVKAVPIYEDALQPLAKETGKALGTIGKTVNVALSPLSLVVWGYDQVSDFLESNVAEKLKEVPEDRIISPALNVVGPAVEALKFNGEEKTLQEMFSNLIANALDSKTALEAHPSFVDIIKNLSSDEGLILRAFAKDESMAIVDIILRNKSDVSYSVLYRNVSLIGDTANCRHIQLTGNYLDNLCRLGILEIPPGRMFQDNKAYSAIMDHERSVQVKNNYREDKGKTIDFEKKVIALTGMGRQFIRACVIDKRLKE